jgi:hypothetical protein
MRAGEWIAMAGILGILAAILSPVFHRAQQISPMLVCISNMEKLGAALDLYVQDWDDHYPMNRFGKTPGQVLPETGAVGLEGSYYNWKRALLDNGYVKDKQVFFCPSNPNQFSPSLVNGCRGDESNCVGQNKGSEERQLPNSYAINGAYFHEQYGPRSALDIADPESLILLLEERSGGYPDLGDWAADTVFAHSNRRANWLFVDSTVKSLKLVQTIDPIYLWRVRGDGQRMLTPQMIPHALR